MNKPPRCVVCKQTFAEKHFFYATLCLNCGNLNYEKRLQTADLKGKIALVTGGRMKIGYAVALRLLENGAFVIVTTRFPHDAAQKFAQEKDYNQWGERLQIYGLDFRDLGRVENFTHHLINVYPKLDIIINNAAQTVRRPPAFYQHLIPFESLNYDALPSQIKPLLNKYHQRDNILNESVENYGLSMIKTQDNIALLSQIPLLPEDQEFDINLFPEEKLTEDGEQLDLRKFNSWFMRDDEVSIIEILEVHIINAIAPFIINSRLKKMMMKSESIEKYIINVSSVEGKFNKVDKSWRHPHTNMAKASFNMMTRTCAKEYIRHKIYMNAVDPGWISFQHPEFKQQEMISKGIKTTFDYIDGVSRICDPIYMSMNENKKFFGKFFKDYKEVEW